MKNLTLTLPRTFQVKAVQKAYSHVAWTYDIWSRFTESKAPEKALELAEIQNGENILEVAVGTGIVFEEIVKCNRDGKNVGMDLTANKHE